VIGSEEEPLGSEICWVAPGQFPSEVGAVGWEMREGGRRRGASVHDIYDVGPAIFSLGISPDNEAGGLETTDKALRKNIRSLDPSSGDTQATDIGGLLSTRFTIP